MNTQQYIYDLVIPMYNLIEYGSIYLERTRCLWFYPKDGAADFDADIANDNSFKSFKYENKNLGNTVAQVAPNQHYEFVKKTIGVPLRYLSNF